MTLHPFDVSLYKPRDSDFRSYGQFTADNLLIVAVCFASYLHLAVSCGVAVFVAWRVIVEHSKRCLIGCDGMEAVTAHLDFLAFGQGVSLADFVLHTTAFEFVVEALDGFDFLAHNHISLSIKAVTSAMVTSPSPFTSPASRPRQMTLSLSTSRTPLTTSSYSLESGPAAR